METLIVKNEIPIVRTTAMLGSMHDRGRNPPGDEVARDAGPDRRAQPPGPRSTARPGTGLLEPGAHRPGGAQVPARPRDPGSGGRRAGHLLPRPLPGAGRAAAGGGGAGDGAPARAAAPGRVPRPALAGRPAAPGTPAGHRAAGRHRYGGA